MENHHRILDIQAQLPSPSYVIDTELLERNLQHLLSIKKHTGCTILLALKGFAGYHTFPLIQNYLDGSAASSLHEFLLAKEHFNTVCHVYSPAYKAHEIAHYCKGANHIVFNSLSQWKKYKSMCTPHRPKLQIGLRINPEHSVVKTALYDPSHPNSRLGVPISSLTISDLNDFDGIMVHNCCESNSDALEITLEKLKTHLGDALKTLQWINLGGGHALTSKDYDLNRLFKIVQELKDKYGLHVILEPGSAVVYQAGYLVSTVLDIINNPTPIAMLDVSVSAHMPDVLEMPYRPDIITESPASSASYTYQLGGLSCLAGDHIGKYSFKAPLSVNDILIFKDMVHYTIVKNTTFNGVPLPSIVILDKDHQFKTVTSFGYEHYKDRL